MLKIPWTYVRTEESLRNYKVLGANNQKENSCKFLYCIMKKEEAANVNYSQGTMTARETEK